MNKSCIIFTFFLLTLTSFVVYSKEKKDENPIIFYDYNPDIVLRYATIDTCKIDINQDGILDVVFYLYHTSTGNWNKIQSLNKDCKFSLMNYYPDQLMNNDSIRWYSTQTDLLMEVDNSEKVGIRIQENGNYFYGWIKVYITVVNLERYLNIDKYAFCTIPNYPLLWGQTEIKTGKKDYTEGTNLIECSNPVTRLIQVRFKENVSGTFEIYDLQGKLVLQKGLKPEPTNIYLPQNGIYIYKFTNENGKVQTGKVEVK